MRDIESCAWFAMRAHVPYTKCPRPLQARRCRTIDSADDSAAKRESASLQLTVHLKLCLQITAYTCTVVQGTMGTTLAVNSEGGGLESVANRKNRERNKNGVMDPQYTAQQSAGLGQAVQLVTMQACRLERRSVQKYSTVQCQGGTARYRQVQAALCKHSTRYTVTCRRVGRQARISRRRCRHCLWPYNGLTKCFKLTPYPVHADAKNTTRRLKRPAR